MKNFSCDPKLSEFANSLNGNFIDEPDDSCVIKNDHIKVFLVTKFGVGDEMCGRFFHKELLYINSNKPTNEVVIRKFSKIDFLKNLTSSSYINYHVNDVEDVFEFDLEMFQSQGLKGVNTTKGCLEIQADVSFSKLSELKELIDYIESKVYEKNKKDS